MLPNAQNAVRRPKYRPRIRSGTISLIHVVQALLPATPRSEMAAATASRTARCSASDSGNHGKAASTSGSWRATPMVHSAVRRLPWTCVSHAEGICTSCAAKGSAPSRPTRTGASPR